MMKSELPKKTLDFPQDKWENSKMNLRSSATKTMNTKSVFQNTKFPSSESTLRVKTRSQFWAKNASVSTLWSKSATAKSKLLVEKFRNTSRASVFLQPNSRRWELRWAISKIDLDQLLRNPKLTSFVSKNCSLRTAPWEMRCALPNKTCGFQLDRSEG